MNAVLSEPLTLKFPPPDSVPYRVAASIVRKLKTSGYDSYLVGGAVRDWVSGKIPHDFDIATAAPPEAVMTLFDKSIPLGVSFGVVTVVIDDMSFEVATFREERDYQDGRRPESLRYSRTPAEDVARRDFTINALLYDPDAETVLDYTGGLADLRRGVVRTIGDAHTRFFEDYLRMLRAVRFAVRFGFELDAASAGAIRDLAPKLKYLSAERVRDELTKMLCGPSPHRAFQMLSDTGILAVVLPEIEAERGVEQPKKYHPEGDVFVHTLLLLAHLAAPTPEIGWAALLHDIGKPSCRTVGADGVAHFYGHEEVGADMAETLLRRLKMSGALTSHVTAAVRNHMRFAAVQKMRPAKWRRLIADPNFPLELELHRLDCIACHGLLENYVWLLDRMNELHSASSESLPPPLVSGIDLIRRGVKPGPRLGELLTTLRDAQLDGRISSREEALRELEKLLA